MYSWVYFPDSCIVSSSSAGTVFLKLNSAMSLEGFFLGVVRMRSRRKGKRPKPPACRSSIFSVSAGRIRDRVPSGVRRSAAKARMWLYDRLRLWRASAFL